MALPAGLATVTVTCGPYIDVKGVPYTGTVTFTPSTPVIWRATGVVILDGPVTVTLDAAGSGAIVLPATDAAGLSVTGFTYTVTVAAKSATGARSTILPSLIQLPAASPAVDLDLLVAVETSSGVVVAVPAVVSVAGLSGAVQVADLKTALGLGTAAYQPATAFDAAGAAAAVQSASAQKSANLSDLSSASTARTNLGLGTAATHPAGDFDAAGAAAAAQANAIGVSAGLALVLGG